MKKCREVMTGNPVCCVPTDTAARIAKLMKTENIGSVPICEDRHGKKGDGGEGADARPGTTGRLSRRAGHYFFTCSSAGAFLPLGST